MPIRSGKEKIRELRDCQDRITDMIRLDHSVQAPDGLLLDYIRTHALQNNNRFRLLENSSLTSDERNKLVRLIEDSIEEIIKALKPDMQSRLHELLLEEGELPAEDEQLDRDFRYYNAKGDGLAGIAHLLANADFLLKYVPILNVIDLNEVVDISKEHFEMWLPSDSVLIKDSKEIENIASLLKVFVELERSKTAGDKISRLPGELLEDLEDKSHAAISKMLPGKVFENQKIEVSRFFEALFNKAGNSGVFRTVNSLPNQKLSTRVMAVIGALKGAEVLGVIERPEGVSPTFLKSQAVSLIAYPEHAAMILENIRETGYENALYDAYGRALPDETAASLTALQQSSELRVSFNSLQRDLRHKIDLLQSHYGLKPENEPLASLATYVGREFEIALKLIEPPVLERSIEQLRAVDETLEPILQGCNGSHYQIDDSELTSKVAEAVKHLADPNLNIHRMLMAHREFGFEQIPYKRIIINNAMNSAPAGGAKLALSMAKIKNPLSYPFGLLTAVTDLNSSVRGRMTKFIDSTWEKISHGAAGVFPYNRISQTKLTLGLDIKSIIDTAKTTGASPFHKALLSVCNNDAEYALLSYCGLAKSAANVGLIEGADTKRIRQILTRAYIRGETTQEMALSALSTIDSSSNIGEKIKNVAANLNEYERTEGRVIGREDAEHKKISDSITQYKVTR